MQIYIESKAQFSSETEGLSGSCFRSSRKPASPPGRYICMLRFFMQLIL